MEVFYKNCEGLLDEAEFEQKLADVPPSRRERIIKVKQKKGRALALAAECCLQKGFAKYNIDSQCAVFATTRKGKPYLPDYPRCHFNISHSGDMAAVVFADKPVGIDIERCIPRRYEKILSYFSEEERSYVSAQKGEEAKLLSFLELWTRKESFLKATGDGLIRELYTIDALSDLKKERLWRGYSYIFQQIVPIDGYTVSVCIQKK